LLRFGFLAAIWGLIAAAVVLLILAWDLPRPEAALATTRRPSTTLLASDGKLLATNGDLYGETLRLRDICRPPSSPLRIGASVTIGA
jgi:penicillin-binding protein 1A